MPELDHRPTVGRIDHGTKGGIYLVVAKRPASGDVDDDFPGPAEPR